MLDVAKHRITMLNIFQEIFSNNDLAGQLVFKGGTCLYLFYNLDRFSTDLDFDIRDAANDINAKKLGEIVAKNIEVNTKESRLKRFGYTWTGWYEHGQRKMKIDVNKIRYPQKIVHKPYYGLNIPTLAKEQMLAQKLCAIIDRDKNRDLYDVHFMLSQMWDIDEETIRFRKDISINECLQAVLDKIDSVGHKYILNGLGEVLDEKQKIWVKNHLVDSLRRQLLIRIS
jgi:predicted nucleotidyltransferase component of viral defense system